MCEAYGLDLYLAPPAACIDADICVYGLPGIPIDEPPLCSLSNMALRVVSLIRRVQVHGSFWLAG
jgi:thioesterase domain-containing protein